MDCGGRRRIRGELEESGASCYGCCSSAMLCSGRRRVRSLRPGRAAETCGHFNKMPAPNVPNRAESTIPCFCCLPRRRGSGGLSAGVNADGTFSSSKHYPASGNLSNPCIVPVHPLTLLFTPSVQSNLLSGQKYAQVTLILVGA